MAKLPASRASPLLLVSALLILNVLVLGHALFAVFRVERLNHHDSYLKYAMYYLQDIPFVFSPEVRPGSSHVSLPALILASSQIGLLAVWTLYGRGTTSGRLLMGAVGIWLWGSALSFVHGWVFTSSRAASLFVPQFLFVIGLLLFMRLAQSFSASAGKRGYLFTGRPSRVHFSLRGIFLVVTLTASIIVVMPLMALDSWIIIQGLGAALGTLIGLATGLCRNHRLRVVLGFLMAPLIGFALMYFYDSQYWPGSHTFQYWAFSQYYMPYICWITTHTVITALAVWRWASVKRPGADAWLPWRSLAA